MSKIVTELGQLIDCTEEEFREYCKDKDLGFVQSFHNLMVQTYNEVQSIKNELVSKMANKKLKKPEKKKYKETLQGLYAKLLRIEHRVFILRDIIRERTLS